MGRVPGPVSVTFVSGFYVGKYFICTKYFVPKSGHVAFFECSRAVKLEPLNILFPPPCPRRRFFFHRVPTLPHDQNRSLVPCVQRIAFPSLVRLLRHIRPSLQVPIRARQTGCQCVKKGGGHFRYGPLSKLTSGLRIGSGVPDAGSAGNLIRVGLGHGREHETVGPISRRWLARLPGYLSPAPTGESRGPCHGRGRARP